MRFGTRVYLDNEVMWRCPACGECHVFLQPLNHPTTDEPYSAVGWCGNCDWEDEIFKVHISAEIVPIEEVWEVEK